jgi:hypothetical protein
MINRAANASYLGVTSGYRRSKFLVDTKDFRRREVIAPV